MFVQSSKPVSRRTTCNCVKLYIYIIIALVDIVHDYRNRNYHIEASLNRLEYLEYLLSLALEHVSTGSVYLLTIELFRNLRLYFIRFVDRLCLDRQELFPRHCLYETFPKRLGKS